MKILSLLLTIPMLTNVSIAGDKITIEKLDQHFYDKHIRHTGYGYRVEYDRRNGGSTKKIEPKALAVLKQNKQLIYETAKKFPDVHPETIAACILAENTMNVGVSDQAQMWLANNSKMAFSIVSKAFGKSANTVSLGLGQINVEAARAAEPYIQKLEKRDKPRTDLEILDQIKTAEGSLLYAGGILQDAIDRYKEAGFDITKNPDIQCTLYNIGKASRRAQRSKDNNRAPRVNYFGFFVNQNFDIISDDFKFYDIKDESEKPAVKKKVKKKVARINLPIYKTPGNCDENSNPISADTSASGRINSKGKVVETITETIDCNLKAWTQVQSGNSIGWVPSEFLEKSVALKSLDPQKAKLTCDEQKVRSCKDKLIDLGVAIADQTHNNIIRFDNSTFLNQAKNNRADHEYYHRHYARNIKRTALRELSSELGIRVWEDPRNPYKDAFKWLDEYQRCEPRCYVDMGFNSTTSLEHFYYYFQQRERYGKLTDKSVKNNIFWEKMRNAKVRKKQRNFRKTSSQGSSQSTRPSTPDRDIHSMSDKRVVLAAVERKKNAILSWHNKNKRDKITNWQAGNNPYKDLFNWVEEYTKCEFCSVSSSSGNLTPKQLDTLVARKGLLSSSKRMKSLKSLSLKKHNALDSNGNKLYSDNFSKMINMCERANASVDYRALRKSYSKFNHDVLQKDEKESLKKLISSATESCRTTVICNNENKDSDLTCKIKEKDKNVQSACSYLNGMNKELAQINLQDISCLLSVNKECHTEILRNKEKLDDIAKLDCVDQIYLSDKSDYQDLKTDLKEDKTIKKMIYSPFKAGRGLAVAVKNACSQ